MRISKKSNKVAACDETYSTELDPNSDYVMGDECAVESLDTCVSSYSCACSKIMEAIESLAEFAESDQIAKDAIANLSVIYFELK